MVKVSVDLDNTLIRTHQDYIDAHRNLASFISEEYGEDAEEVFDLIRQIDKNKIMKESAVHLERLPDTYEEVLREFNSNPDDEELIAVRRISQEAYKTEEEYSDRGFIPGAESMLEKLSNSGCNLILVTTGVESLQRRKIRGLGLSRFFNSFIINPSLDKSYHFNNLIDSQPDYHIGDSVDSDVKPALECGITPVFLGTNRDWLLDKNNIDGKFMDQNNVHYYDDPEHLSINIEELIN